MRASTKFLFLAALLAGVWAHDANADKKTVCSITVNSADEKEAFRRSLPPDKYQFVELVERGRSDWLESACRQGIRCDVLVISGHYDGGNEFFSDQLEAREFLPVAEMERVSCSDSCPGLFSQLKEVYLFGCNTLNPEALKSATAEIVRSLIRSGHSRADAERVSRALSAQHGESSRDRMRLIFKDVPVIYGFSSVAPLGPMAGSILSRHFQSAGTGEVGGGRSSARLLGQFAGHSLAVSSGVTDSDPRTAYRRDVCQFADDRLPSAQKVDFIHRLLRREMAEVRMFLDRIEAYSASLGATERQTPEVAHALERIARDEAARARYLDFARDADQPAVRARLLLALTSPNDEEVQIAQVYLRHQPIADVEELRVVTSGIARMNGSSAKVRALDTLAAQNLSDPESLEELARLFPLAESIGIQTAIAGVLIRSDYKVLARPELVQTLQQHRLRSSNGADLIDVLIRRLQAQ